MTPPRPKNRRNRRKAEPRDLWRAVAPIPPAPPVVPAADPAALLRSLGRPPLPGQGTVAEHYLAAVVERAAGMAVALAAAAGVLADSDEG